MPVTTRIITIFYVREFQTVTFIWIFDILDWGGVDLVDIPLFFKKTNKSSISKHIQMNIQKSIPNGSGWNIPNGYIPNGYFGSLQDEKKTQASPSVAALSRSRRSLQSEKLYRNRRFLRLSSWMTKTEGCYSRYTSNMYRLSINVQTYMYIYIIFWHVSGWDFWPPRFYFFMLPRSPTKHRRQVQYINKVVEAGPSCDDWDGAGESQKGSFLDTKAIINRRSWPLKGWSSFWPHIFELLSLVSIYPFSWGAWDRATADWTDCGTSCPCPSAVGAVMVQLFFFEGLQQKVSRRMRVMIQRSRKLWNMYIYIYL